ncbi:MAG: lasso peptide biosynthesis B2 protein [Actinobacteria bacterium]|nr:lasso peptide biosynthesis B2 protein [Actinomycetota bacterium]
MTELARLADERPLPAGKKLALAGEVAASYAVARWLLRRRGLRSSLELLRRPAASAGDGGPPGAADEVGAGRRLGRATTRTLAVLPADSSCLMSSLVLTRLLARRGISSRLVIAVEPGERFGAHAWVEHDGAALLSPGGDSFEQLVTL